MFRELKPYAVAVESAAVWLGPVPQGWSMRRMKQLFTERVEKNRPEQPLLAATQRHGVIRKSDYETRTVTAQKDLHLLKYASFGDFVISLRSFEGGIEHVNASGIISPAYTILTPVDDSYRAYASLLFKSRPLIDGLTLSITGIREGQNVDYSRLARGLLPVPPAEEQAAIVKYLGHAHGRIDRAIAAKRKMIALLEEQKQAIINQAVTRGLDPTIPMKDSGIPWLGQIPVNWQLRRLGTLMSIATGSRDTINKVDDGEFPFYVRSNTVERIDTCGFDGEAVLTAGDGAGVGKVFHYANGPFDYHQRVYRFSDFGEVTGKYFFEYLRSTLKNETSMGTAKSTVDSLRRPMLRNFPVPVPPRSEQMLIVARVRDEATRVDEVIRRASLEIKLLREFRTRLTSDVVTGQIDVRGIAATLPDFVEQAPVDANSGEDEAAEFVEDVET